MGHHTNICISVVLKELYAVFRQTWSTGADVLLSPMNSVDKSILRQDLPCDVSVEDDCQQRRYEQATATMAWPECLYLFFLPIVNIALSPISNELYGIGIKTVVTGSCFGIGYVSVWFCSCLSFMIGQKTFVTLQKFSDSKLK